MSDGFSDCESAPGPELALGGVALRKDVHKGGLLFDGGRWLNWPGSRGPPALSPRNSAPTYP